MDLFVWNDLACLGELKFYFDFFSGNIALLVCWPQETNDFFFFNGKEANGLAYQTKKKKKEGNGLGWK